jgi:hypothetical protein
MMRNTAQPADRSRRRASGRTPSRSDRAAQIAEILRGYAQRGMFRGFADKPSRGSTRTFNVVWHYDRQYPLVVDFNFHTLSFPALLPAISARSPMVEQLRAFLRPFSSDELPAHRRVNPDMGRLILKTQKGALTLTMEVKGGHYDYCTRKLVHIAHEIFMVFLWDGPYYEYRVDSLGLDPDAAWP